MSKFQEWVEKDFRQKYELDESELSNNTFGLLVWDYQQRKIDSLADEIKELKFSMEAVKHHPFVRKEAWIQETLTPNELAPRMNNGQGITEEKGQETLSKESGGFGKGML